LLETRACKLQHLFDDENCKMTVTLSEKAALNAGKSGISSIGGEKPLSLTLCLIGDAPAWDACPYPLTVCSAAKHRLSLEPVGEW
jgi:hypothetical protein